jgi:hypothetical protein
MEELEEAVLQACNRAKMRSRQFLGTLSGFPYAAKARHERRHTEARAARDPTLPRTTPNKLRASMKLEYCLNLEA